MNTSGFISLKGIKTVKFREIFELWGYVIIGIVNEACCLPALLSSIAFIFRQILFSQ